MVYGKIICYNLKAANLTRREIDSFHKELYGRRDKSNYGRYTYLREGLLDKIPHIKPIRSVLVVSVKSNDEIMALLERYNAEIFARDIVLIEEDIKQLRIH